MDQFQFQLHTSQLLLDDQAIMIKGGTSSDADIIIGDLDVF